MVRQNTVLCLLLFTLLLAQASCGGSKPTGSLALSISAGGGQQDIDPGLLERLSAELERAMLEHGSLKRVATAPTSELSQVTDFQVSSVTGEGTTYSWTYRNQGDFDQNGEVNLADITPIALKFGMALGQAGWVAAQPVDGDGNGEINLSDITPLAMNFNNVVQGYLLLVSATPEDPESWTILVSVPFSAGVMPEEGGYLQFSILVADPPVGSYLQVSPYYGDPEASPEIGSAGNEVLAAELEAPQDLAASKGDFSAQIRLDWTQSSGATGYEIYRDSIDSPFESVGDVTEWFDEVGDLDEHAYWLKSIYPTGTSPFGDPATGFASRQGDWWMLGREPMHNALSPIQGPQDNDLKWVFQAGENIMYSSPSIAADGTVYIGTDGIGISNLVAINPDGSLKWQFAAPNFVESSPAIAKDGSIYFGTQDAMYALKPDGTQDWTYPLSGFIFSSPAIGPDGTIYIGGYDSLLYAINPSGSLKWGRPTSGVIWSSPGISADGTIYVGNESGQFYGISPSGDIDWTFDANGYIRLGPAIGVDGVIYFGTGGGTFYALNPTGKERWSFPVGSPIFSSPAIASDGTIYFGSENGDLFALNPNGTLKWRFETGEFIWVESSPTIGSDGVIYFGAADGMYYALNVDGSLLWEFQAEGYFTSGSAIAEDGTLYAPCEDGNLFAFGTPEPIPPIAPTGLTATDGILYQAIRLDWDSKYGVDTYQIFKDDSVDPVGTVDEATTSWVDTPVEDETPHTYKLKAVNTFGASPFSNEATGAANTSPPGPGDWFMFGHDQAHTRVSPFIGPSSEVIKWITNIGTASYSSVAIGNYGELYVGSSSNVLTCVNLDGTVRWTFDTPSYVGGSPAIGPDGTLYVGDFSGMLFAINPAGTELWNYPTGGTIYSSPNLADDGTIYFGSIDTNLYALNPDGSLKWRYQTAGEIWSSPAIGSDGTIYFGNNDNKVFGVNPDGTEKWIASVGGEARSSPAVWWDLGSGDSIYIGCNDNKFYAFDSDGIPLWDYTTDGSVFSSPGIGPDGTIYVGSYDNYVYAFYPNGSLKWSSNMFASVGSSPAIDPNGVVWVGDSGGFLNALSPVDGSFLWYGLLGGQVWDSSPAIGPDGTVYLTNTFGNLFAYGPGS